MTKNLRKNFGKEAAAIQRFIDIPIMTIESPLLPSPILSKKIVIPVDVI